jgi:predicted RNase H-like nuclease (RuvC/YqgF family)
MMQLNESLAAAPEDRLSQEEQNRRLQAMVGELLKTNQELRFKVASLEREAESLERGLKSATASAGFMF